MVEDMCQSEGDGTAVCVPDVGRQESALQLLGGEAEHLGGPGGELPVGLVEYHVVVVGRGGAHGLHHHLGGGRHMPEVGGLPAEPPAVHGIHHTLPPPEVGGVGGETEGLVDLCDDLLGTEQVGGTSRRGRVLEGVPGGALRGVGPDGDGVLHHPGLDETETGLYAGGTCLAGELEVCGGHVGGGPYGLGDDGRRGLDGVRVALGPYVDGPDVGGVHVGDPVEHVPGGLGGDRNGILVGRGYGLLVNHQTFSHGGAVGAPYPSDLFRLYPVPGDVCPVTYYSNHFHFPSLSAFILSISFSTERSVVTRGIPSFSASLMASGSV